MQFLFYMILSGFLDANPEGHPDDPETRWSNNKVVLYTKNVADANYFLVILTYSEPLTLFALRLSGFKEK